MVLLYSFIWDINKYNHGDVEGRKKWKQRQELWKKKVTYRKDDINKCTHKAYEQIWEYDKQKTQCAITHGYEVLRIWESDYKQNPLETINKCITFLNS